MYIFGGGWGTGGGEEETHQLKTFDCELTCQGVPYLHIQTFIGGMGGARGGWRWGMMAYSSPLLPPKKVSMDKQLSPLHSCLVTLNNGEL